MCFLPLYHKFDIMSSKINKEESKSMKKVAFYTLRLQSQPIRNQWNDSKIYRKWR